MTLVCWTPRPERLPSLVEAALAAREPEWRRREEEPALRMKGAQGHGTPQRAKSCSCGQCQAFVSRRNERVKHGTRYRFRAGCRCDLCVEAARREARETKRRHTKRKQAVKAAAVLARTQELRAIQGGGL
jgi:hypothetical protein